MAGITAFFSITFLMLSMMLADSSVFVISLILGLICLVFYLVSELLYYRGAYNRLIEKGVKEQKKEVREFLGETVLKEVMNKKEEDEDTAELS